MNRPATRWGERIYGVLVALYPRDFRVRYGPAMRLALRDLLDDPEMQAWRIWFSVLRDLRGSFLHEHLANVTGGISMARGRLLLGALVRSALAKIRTHRTGTVARLARVAMLIVLIVTPVATGAVGYYLGRSQVSPVAEPALFPESTFAIFRVSTDGTGWTRVIPERICGTSRVGADGMFYLDTRESCGLRRSW
jgi:hypothetical protein